MTHRPIHSPSLPKPVGPYSPGMGFERLIFVSGQGATDPATDQLAGADAAAQTEQCLRNLRTILVAGGSDLQYVLRCGVFLLDMNEFSEMNAVYQRVFGNHRPARTTIQAAALPGEGLRVEIDCIAYRPDQGAS
ncbi:MAG: Rid family detoxifying hydrolase [Gemmatimonadaceae bacterium]